VSTERLEGFANRTPALLALLVLTLLCACDRSDEERTIAAGNEHVPVARFQEAGTALCTARDQARSDVKQANTTFYDRSHDALHTLARALDPVDRAAAARLLEDKERVETDFRRNASVSELAASLEALARSTRTGLAALSVEVPACP
jgi:hypothetical protein